jgi:hypothetical protein
MEINERKIVEIFVAIILIISLIILIFLFTGSPVTGKSTETPSTVSNSYNVNSYNKNYYNYPSYRYKDKDYPRYYKKDYYLKYSYRAEHKKYEGMFGNEIDKYIVYVKNKDYKGGYFTVKFYFTDYYGEKRTKSIRHYIKPGEERKFFYQSIYSERYEYYDWDYKVISETKVFK